MRQLRLITPVDQEGAALHACDPYALASSVGRNDVAQPGPRLAPSAHHEDAPQANNIQKHYQLTHDYLVGPIRQWLAQKQKETRRGRAN